MGKGWRDGGKEGGKKKREGRREGGKRDRDEGKEGGEKGEREREKDGREKEMEAMKERKRREGRREGVNRGRKEGISSELFQNVKPSNSLAQCVSTSSCTICRFPWAELTDALLLFAHTSSANQIPSQ